MAIETLYPAIRPSLNLDFAGSKTLDPRITFTRASAATYYDGKTVAKAEENLLTYSQQITAGVGAWAGQGLATGTTVNSAQAPDATVTASTINVTSGAGGVRYYSTIPAGTYTVSVYIRSVSGSTDFAIDFENLYSTSFTLSSVWQRVTATVTFAVTRTWIDFQISAPGVFEIWGAQLEQRSQVTAYTPTTTQPITNYIPVLQTAPAGVPRFDHNPVTGESLGLLVEEQRTNLLTYSEQFEMATWLKYSGTVSTNVAFAPDGTQTSDVFTASGTTHPRLERVFSIPATDTIYTWSVYAKRGSNSFIALGHYSVSASAMFNLDTGTLVYSSYALSTSITNAGNGWYRVSMTLLVPSAAVNNAFKIHQTDGTIGGTTGVAGGYVYIWGAQLEVGSFPTSYIKTEASQVTRAPDSAQMTGASFSSWYLQVEGTLLVEARNTIGATVFSTAVLTDDQALQTNNRLALFNRPNGVSGPAALVTYNGSEQITNGFSFKENNKIAVAYKNNDVTAALNGATSAQDTAANIPAFTRLRIGQLSAGSDFFATQTIKRLVYYPKALPGSVQALTT